MKPASSSRPASRVVPYDDEYPLSIAIELKPEAYPLIERTTVDPLRETRFPEGLKRVIHEAERIKLKVAVVGRKTLTVRGTAGQFKAAFDTALKPENRVVPAAWSNDWSVVAKKPTAWLKNDVLRRWVRDVQIQPPHEYFVTSPDPFAGVEAVPPPSAAIALDVAKDVPRLLGASRLRARGITGRGVRLAMIDSGFAHRHPFFVERQVTSQVLLTPGATNPSTELERDDHGHGTGESANVFAIAPDVDFIGVKVNNDSVRRRSGTILEGLQTLLSQPAGFALPSIISISMGYDLSDGLGTQFEPPLPNRFGPLMREIGAAMDLGIVVVAAAGNGSFSFPGQMPGVLSVGGVYRDPRRIWRASNYASAFKSAIFDGRSVPDLCGLVGRTPNAMYIKLPVPPGSFMDTDKASNGDGTSPGDGWALFSGTSAAAPQVAAVCALLLSDGKSATPNQIFPALFATCRDITRGAASARSSATHRGRRAGPGRDAATGYGLVRASIAWRRLHGNLPPLIAR